MKNKKGVEFTMGMLAVIIIIVIGIILFLLFFTGYWGKLTGTLGVVEEQAVTNFTK